MAEYAAGSDRVERERGGERAAARLGQLEVLAREVLEPAAGDQGGRPAAVEVERVPAAERDHEAGQLEQRQPGVVTRAAVAGDGEDAPVGQPDRGARVAADRRVGVELVGGGLEALVVAIRVVRDLAAGDE